MTNPYRLEFSLLGLPKGPNSSFGIHWAIKARERKKWREQVVIACIGKAPPIPLSKCAIQCTRVSKKEMDYDNMVASFKPVIDGLVDAKIIKDDDSSVIVQREYKYEKNKTSGIKVVVIEI